MARAVTAEPRTKDLLALMGPVGGSIGRIFDLMEVAEEELKRAGQPKGMFMALLPPESMRDLIPDVYRSHCRELLARHKAGKSLEDPTRAELLCAVADVSLKAPLNATGAAAYMRLAKEVLRDERGRSLIPPDLLEDLPREPYKGAVDELLSGLHRRLFVPGRQAEPTRATTLGAFA
jgi:hypothetical protein